MSSPYCLSRKNNDNLKKIKNKLDSERDEEEEKDKGFGKGRGERERSSSQNCSLKNTNSILQE